MEIGRNRDPAVGIAGSVDAVLRQLTEAARAHTWPVLGWSEELQSERESWLNDLMSTPRQQAPMHAARVFEALKLPCSATTTTSYSTPATSATSGGRPCPPEGRGAGGTSRPSECWAWRSPLESPSSWPTRAGRVIVFNGDGGFGFNGMELDTAVRHGLPIVVVLGNDAAWGIDRQIQMAVYGKPVATDLHQSRYDMVAEGLGAYGQLVESPEDLAPRLRAGRRLRAALAPQRNRPARRQPPRERGP